jgi:hypothetical protein
MRVFLFYIFLGILIGAACKCPNKTTQISSQSLTSSMIRQGIKGKVLLVYGNQMPSPSNTGKKNSSDNAYPTTVFFYEPTNINQVIQENLGPLFNSINTKLVCSIKTDSTGAFIAALPVGTYSVFVQVDKLFFANNFDSRNNISLVLVEPNKLTEIKVIVNNNATY